MAVPSRELALQVCAVCAKLAAYCSKEIRIWCPFKNANIELDSLSKSIVIATPAKLLALAREKLKASSVSALVIDEADLMLGFGYLDELQGLISLISGSPQLLLVSATVPKEIMQLVEHLMVDLVSIEVDIAEDDRAKLKHFYVQCKLEKKYLTLYVLLRTKIIRGRCLIFVESVESCYRLKLFLDQFYIKACVLNHELPHSSRYVFADMIVH